MIANGIDFGRVLCSSGARGFYGEGYWHHKIVDWSGSTFVAKTVTLEAKAGNMLLDGDLRPRERVPRCIVVKPLKGVVLNSVGLSNPGIEVVMGRWKDKTVAATLSPWMASVMAVSKTKDERVVETAKIFAFLKGQQNDHRARMAQMGLQVNLSCPNAGVHAPDLVEEAREVLDLSEVIGGTPVFCKVSATMLPADAAKIANHERCVGIVSSNTIPWGQMPERVDWEGLFGSGASPLAHLGGGGLSGKPLLPIVRDWVYAFRNFSKKLVIAGGGVLSPEDADALFDAGADAVELGSVSILRPWRVKKIIERINERRGP